MANFVMRATKEISSVTWSPAAPEAVPITIVASGGWFPTVTTPLVTATLRAAPKSSRTSTNTAVTGTSPAGAPGSIVKVAVRIGPLRG